MTVPDKVHAGGYGIFEGAAIQGRRKTPDSRFLCFGGSADEKERRLVLEAGKHCSKELLFAKAFSQNWEQMESTMASGQLWLCRI